MPEAGIVCEKGGPEGRRLRIAERRERRGGVGDRAVVLAELDGIAAVMDGGGIARIGQGIGDGADGIDRLRREVRDELRGPLLRECGDAGLSLGLLDEAQRLQGEVVVGRPEHRATARGDAVDERRPATAGRGGRAEGSPLAGDDEAAFQEGGEGAPDGRRRHPEAVGELGRRCGALLEQAAGDPLCSLTGDFHNAIVA